MVRSNVLRRWQAEVVQSLLAVDGVELSLLIVDSRSSPSRAPRDRLTRLGRSNHTVWDLYNNGWVARKAASLQPVTMNSTFDGVPQLQVVVRKEGYSEYFEQADIDVIAAHGLDFILRFAFGIIRGPVLEQAARYGVWSFHHGDEDQYRGSPPAFWELVHDKPVTGAVLQRLTDRLDGGVILEKGWFSTCRHSYPRNTDAVHFGGVSWPAKAARQLLEVGDLPLAYPSTSTAPIYRRPKNGETLSFLAKQAGRFVKAQWRGLARSDLWDVGIAEVPVSRFLNSSSVPAVRWLGLAERGVAYAADPFACQRNGELSVLYERFDSRRRIGEIWQTTVSDDAAATPARLPVACHASYPFCIAGEDGRLYCVPQVDESGLSLFEWVAGSWSRSHDLLPGRRLLDPTVLRHDGKWWLFGTPPGRASLTELHVFFSDELAGPWAPHPLNPVKTDVRSARPAGTPFFDRGTLFRPAQDCSEGYGGAVSICEVLELSVDRFEERVAAVVQPSAEWGFSEGIHTLSAAGEFTLVDGRRSVFDRHESWAELRARARRVWSRRHSTGGSKQQSQGVRSIRVLAVINALGEGGTERSLAETIPGLRSRGIEVTVAILRSRGDEGVERSLREQGVDIRLLPTGLARVRALRRLIREVRPDVVHSMLYEANQVARLACIGTPAVVLTSLVNTSYSPDRFATITNLRWKYRVAQALDRLTGRLLVDHFHAVSESVRSSAIRTLGISSGRISVVKRGRMDTVTPDREVTRRAVRKSLGIPPDALVVINVGRQEAQKDHRTLVEAMGPILNERDDVWLVVAGREGNASDDLAEAIEGVEHPERILLLGHRGDVAELLAASDVFVLTSRHEGLPGAVIEAMSAGLAVVASDIGPVREVVEPDVTALLAAVGDGVGFTRSIRRLVADPAMRADLAAAGRARFEQHFGIDTATNGMADLYRRLEGRMARQVVAAC